MSLPIPDFDGITETLASIKDDDFLIRRKIKAALIDAWNARGQADAQMIDGSLTSMMGVNAGGPYVKNLQRAIATLDATA